MFFFDARMIASSGIGTQILSVLRQLQKQTSHPVLLGDPFLMGKLLPDSPLTFQPWKAPIYSLAEQYSCPPVGPTDFIHFPHYNVSAKSVSRAFVVVHDLIHLQSPEFRSPAKRLYARFLLGQIARKALHIITVSQATRRTLLEFFPAAESRSSTIYNGIDHNRFRPASRAAIQAFRKKHHLPAEYLLVTGIGKMHKNLDRLLQALQPLWLKRRIPPLVLAGAGGRLPEYAAHVLSVAESEQNLIHLGFLPESELPALYSGCTLFLQPSFLEGFGFPLAEAMACGAVAAAGNRTSLPEVGGKAALYFDPFDIDEMQQVILQGLESASLRKKLKTAGPEQAARFDWNTHVQELQTIYAKYGLALQAKGQL